jgi:hypothetical protein
MLRIACLAPRKLTVHHRIAQSIQSVCQNNDRRPGHPSLTTRDCSAPSLVWKAHSHGLLRDRIRMSDRPALPQNGSLYPPSPFTFAVQPIVAPTLLAAWDLTRHASHVQSASRDSLNQLEGESPFWRDAQTTPSFPARVSSVGDTPRWTRSHQASSGSQPLGGP